MAEGEGGEDVCACACACAEKDVVVVVDGGDVVAVVGDVVSNNSSLS